MSDGVLEDDHWLVLYAMCNNLLPFLYQENLIYVTGFEKTQLPRTIRNTDFNYLRYYNSGREADPCMKFATIL